jgi:hypothetical protein
MTVKTARPLAPVLAQRKMGDTHPAGYRSLDERDGHMTPPLFHQPTHLLKKKERTGTWNLALTMANNLEDNGIV